MHALCNANSNIKRYKITFRKIILKETIPLSATLHLVDKSFLKLLYKCTKVGIFKQVN